MPVLLYGSRSWNNCVCDPGSHFVHSHFRNPMCRISLYQEAEEAAGGAGREAITGKHIVTSVFSPNPHLDKFHILP